MGRAGVAVDDAQVVAVAVNDFHDVVLVEVEQGDTRLSRCIAMMVLPHRRKPGLRCVAPAIDIHGAPRLLLFEEDDFGVRVVVDVTDEGIACAKAVDESLMGYSNL